MVTFIILYSAGPAIEYTARDYADAIGYAKRNANGRDIVCVY